MDGSGQCRWEGVALSSSGGNVARGRQLETGGFPRSEDEPAGPDSILVVDDDDAMRTAIEIVLAPDYRVTLAFDGVDGYLKANDLPAPDLIITDVAMPNLDGLGMINRIRESSELRSVPVIFLTGVMSPALVLRGLSAGAFAYLSKPTSPELLRWKVKKTLSH